MTVKFAIVATAMAMAAGVAGCATTPLEERENAQVAARLATLEPTGETTPCLNIRQIRSIQAATETKLLVQLGLNAFYLSETNGRCTASTRGNTRLQYTTSNGQLCRGDIINVIDNTTGSNFGACSAGEFKELKRVETEES